MKSEEGNDSLDTSIRQAVVKYHNLPFTTTPDNLFQWLQLFNVKDHPDLSSWPLLIPGKTQMQKCEKCSREFCSSINYRRHILVHRKPLNVNKEFKKNRDLLAAFWDKISLKQVNERVFDVVMLKEIHGSFLIRTLASTLKRTGIWTLPPTHVKAGNTLLDIIQANHSSPQISSHELFSILDEASERTFLCAGTAESVLKYVFDGETDKNCLELNNIIACASFVFEQQLMKVWNTDKEAEASKWHKLLVEEEEAEQKRKALLLEKKKQKKLRREQKVKEQFEGSSENIDVNVDAVDVPLSAEATGLSSPYDSNSNPPDMPTNLDFSLESTQPESKTSNEEDIKQGGDSQRRQPLLLEKKRQKELRKEQFEGCSENIDANVDAVDGPISAEASGPSYPYDSNSNPPDMPTNLDSSLESTQPESKESNEEDSKQGGDSQIIKPHMVCPPKGNQHLAANLWQAPKSQRGGRFGLNPQPFKSGPIHKPSLSKDQSLQNRNKVSAKKLITDTDEENPKPSSPPGKASHQIEENNNREVIIGSIPVDLKSSVAQQKEATDISGNEHTVNPKKSASEKLTKANNSLGSKHWMPVRHDETKSALPLDRGSENIEGSGAISGKVPDQTVSSVERSEQPQSVDSLVNQKKPYCVLPIENVQQGHLPFSRSAAKEFLAKRWKEAISSDHVKLVLSEPKPPGSSDVQQEPSTIPNASDPLENQMDRHVQVKISKKPGKGVKIKFIPKQK